MNQHVLFTVQMLTEMVECLYTWGTIKPIGVEGPQVVELPPQMHQGGGGGGGGSGVLSGNSILIC